jgi:hypothetical protein
MKFQICRDIFHSYNMKLHLQQLVFKTRISLGPKHCSNFVQDRLVTFLLSQQFINYSLAIQQLPFYGVSYHCSSEVGSVRDYLLTSYRAHNIPERSEGFACLNFTLRFRNAADEVSLWRPFDLTSSLYAVLVSFAGFGFSESRPQAHHLPSALSSTRLQRQLEWRDSAASQMGGRDETSAVGIPDQTRCGLG